MYGYDGDNGNIELVDSWQNYRSCAWAPVLNSCGSVVVFQLGESVGGDATGEETVMGLYLMEEGRQDKRHLFDIRNASNSYVVPYIDSRATAITEYYEDGWCAVVYDYLDGSYDLYPVPFLAEHEYPVTFSMEEGFLLYESQHSIFYASDTETGSLQVVDMGGGYKFNAQIHGKVYYLNFFGNRQEICSYDPRSNRIQKVELPAGYEVVSINGRSGRTGTLKVMANKEQETEAGLALLLLTPLAQESDQ